MVSSVYLSKFKIIETLFIFGIILLMYYKSNINGLFKSHFLLIL